MTAHVQLLIWEDKVGAYSLSCELLAERQTVSDWTEQMSEILSLENKANKWKWPTFSHSLVITLQLTDKNYTF